MGAYAAEQPPRCDSASRADVRPQALGSLFALLLLPGVGACQDLWSVTLHENPQNCVSTPLSCSSDEVCNPINETCEPSLALDGISPAIGPTSGGLRLSISGRGFLPGTTVSIGQAGLPAEPIAISSPSQLEATLPAAPGTCSPVSIELKRPGGFSVKRDGLFTYFLGTVKFGDGRPVGTSVSNSTVYVLSHDLNGDGLQDVVSTAYNHAGVDIQLAQASGGFLTLPRISTGAGPYHLAVADVDGNQVPDLAVANISAGSVSVLLGSGGGQFSTPLNLTSAAPSSVHFIDANSDGLLDLVALSSNGKVRVWQGNGQGSFQFMSEADIDAGAAISASGDVDGDGRLDLVVSAKSAAALAVHRNLGDGTFRRLSLNLLSVSAATCAIGDLNHDGKLDLVAAEYAAGLTSIFLGNGDGTFAPKLSYSSSPGSRTVVIGDWNCDGHPDLAVSHLGNALVTLLIGHGNGIFERLPNSASLLGGVSSLALATADIDGNGRPDLIIGGDGISPSVQVALNSSQ